MAGIDIMQKMMDITFMTLAYIASLLYICASCVTIAAAGADPASRTTSSMYSASLCSPCIPAKQNTAMNSRGNAISLMKQMKYGLFCRNTHSNRYFLLSFL